MLVGKSIIEEMELKRHVATKEKFYAYCDSLVPEEFRHIKAIIDNQRYYCALLVRKCQEIAWDIKKDLLIQVMTETRVTGLTDSCIEVNNLFKYINRSLMEKYKRRFRHEYTGNNELYS